MTEKAARRVDEDAARAHFDKALTDHEQAFESFFFARFLDLSFAYLPKEAIDADKEACRISFPISEMIKNPQGSVHGGVLASVMDISMGHLINKIDAPGATVEMKIQFMRPLLGATAVCEGSFLKRGRSLSFMESRIWDENGKLAAHATATWKMP